MKIQIVNKQFFCVACDAAIIEKHGRLICQNWTFWHRKHYRGDCADAVGIGAYSQGIVEHLEVPDADSTWTPAETLPAKAGQYETLNSQSGSIQVLFRSKSSGGWWSGQEMWQGLVTHWREA